MLFPRDIPREEVTAVIRDIRARFDTRQRAKAEEKYRYKKLKPGYLHRHRKLPLRSRHWGVRTLD